MAPLQASSGAAPDSRQRPPSTLPRAGASRGRLRYHPLAWGQHWGAVALGGRPVGTVLGRCGATGGDQWRSRGLPVIPRLDLAEVDLGRFRPGAVGLQLRQVESILAKSISLWSWARIWKSPASGQDGRSGPNRFGANRFWPILARASTVHSRYNVHPDSQKSARLKFKVACIRFAEEI